MEDVSIDNVCGYNSGTAIALLQPRIYLSITPLLLNSVGAATFESFAKSAPALDAALSSIPNVPGASKTYKINWLHNITLDSNLKQSQVYNLKVAGRNPEEAQSIANAVLRTALDLMRARPIASQRIQEQISRIEDQQLRDLEKLINKVQSEASSYWHRISFLEKSPHHLQNYWNAETDLSKHLLSFARN